MPRFEKKYVHFMWDDELEGKKVFFSDCIDNLIEFVENNYHFASGTVKQSDSTVRQFCAINQDENFAFAYYDPYYELKLADEQGKVIQLLAANGRWVDLDKSVDSFDDNGTYRVKPDDQKPVANRELARWLAQGNGEYSWEVCADPSTHTSVTTHFDYMPTLGDMAINSRIVVRKWDDTEWHEPTREYMGLEAAHE